MRATRCDNATRKINQTEKDRRREQLATDYERARRIARWDCRNREKVQRHEQRGDRENAAARRRQFPAMLGVQTDPE